MFSILQHITIFILPQIYDSRLSSASLRFTCQFWIYGSQKLECMMWPCILDRMWCISHVIDRLNADVMGLSQNVVTLTYHADIRILAMEHHIRNLYSAWNMTSPHTREPCKWHPTGLAVYPMEYHLSMIAGYVGSLRDQTVVWDKEFGFS